MLEHTLDSATMPARVVVIGAQGFVGRALMRRLARAGAPALALGRAEIDLQAPDAARALAGQLQDGDVVVAIAARAPCKDADMLIENLQIARTLSQALVGTGLGQVINISSDAVYGDSDQPLDEHSPASPESVHGVMHLAREVLLRQSVRVPLAVLRPSLLYGAGDPHNGYGPNRFARLALRQQDIVLFGEGEERRDHVLVDDVAELIWRCIQRRSQGTLNVATGQVHSFRQIAGQIVQASGSRSVVKGSPRQGSMPHRGYRAFDPAATASAFADFRYTPLAQGIGLSLPGWQP